MALGNMCAFLDVYPKSEKESLTDKDKKEIKQFITDFKEQLKKGLINMRDTLKDGIHS
ncbi:hypothetical protein ACFFH2_14880 [Enterococcus devriesei]|uniref:hypothetical protein n=1 Tax=Enterococcus devriesei TaxID=319970 RepID=UPI0035EF3FA7